MLLLASTIALSAGAAPGGRAPILFATYADDAASLENTRLLALSLRAFGGAYRGAPIRLYLPEGFAPAESDTLKALRDLGVEIRTSPWPAGADWFFYGPKPFAAAQAEADATGKTAVLAWLDDDTAVLQEPGEFLLPAGKSLGYRPVMHRNIGLLFDQPLDAFWGRVYELLSVKASSLFPVVTPADGDTLKPYINAGCLALRPERRLLAKWAECFTTLYRDSLLTEMCRQSRLHRVFIHQAALAGAMVTHLSRDEMLELSDRINYPIFFQQMFGAKRAFNDITGVVTFRHESFFRDPTPGWEQQLEGPADRIAWIREHLASRGK
jgi:hypothetical protein